MIKLLNSGFTRLRKNKIFWLLTIFSIGLALFLIFSQYNEMKNYGAVIQTNKLMLNYAGMIGIIIAIFTSLFLGVEYSDGAVRNKISIGHKRSNIYLSNFIIVTITSLFSYVLFMVVVAFIGIPLFGKIVISILSLLKLIGCTFMMIVAFSSFFTFIAMLISNKTISAILSIMLTLGMMAMAGACLDILETQQYIQSGNLVNGEMKFEKQLNPKYPSEKKKKIAQTLLDINPAGQGFQLAGGAVHNLKVLPVYSLGIIAIFTSAGILLFKKKELK